MYDLNTRNVIVIAVACVLGVVTICIACVIGNGDADRHKVQMVRACVDAGNQWVRGDCVRTARP